ncbi:MAG: hypothetical protein KGZ58_09580 [Ignavibacteriales bacterium]|nr:hypothetical protein [Ignavibacteriales bacterium]
MWDDPIVEEIRKYRQEHAAQFNYDIEAIMRDIIESQNQRGGILVSRSIREAKENEQNKTANDAARKAA